MNPRSLLRCPAVFLVLALLAACGRVDHEWQGPTDNFRALDANGDGDVDRFEWEQRQGSRFDASLGFRYADCDSDGRMSWHEYFAGYMRNRHCTGSYLYEPPLPADDTGYAVATSAGEVVPDNWHQGTLLIRPDEQLQIYERMPEGPDVPTLLTPRLHPPPARYSEAELPRAARERVRATSGKLADSILVAHYDPAEKVPGDEARMAFPHLGCDIVNATRDARITMVHIEVDWRANANDSSERWLKPVWIEPGTTQRLDVWFGEPVEAAECRLLDARGQTLP